MAKKTNLGLVAWALSWLGQPYWYGTTVQKCTDALLSGRKSMYPSHYTSSRMSRYRADIKAGKTAMDCSGLIKGYWWQTDDGKQVRGLDGRPDINANMMYERAKTKGPISTLPEIPGLLLHSSGHIGVYIGNGYAVEARGFSYGVVKTKVSSRTWQHWLKSQYMDYIEDGDTSDDPTPASVKRLLKYRAGVTMMRGSDVLFVQNLLAELGYKPGSADGIFGPDTAKAVKAFQRANGLEVDGDVGKHTWAALEKADKAPAPEDDPDGSADETPSADAGDEVIDDDDDKGDATDDGSGAEDDEPAPTFDFGTRILKYRRGYTMQSGADVVNVQKRLEQLGFDVGKVDGIYGPDTDAAVRAFQRAKGLLVDGDVGPDTRRKLAE